MEFPFITTKVLQCDAEGFAVIDGQDAAKYKRSPNNMGAFNNVHRNSSYFRSHSSVNTAVASADD